MRRRVSGTVGIALLAPLLLLGQQKKPVTFEVLDNYSPTKAPAVVWSPKGKEFVHEDAGKLFLYQAPGAKSRELIEMKTLESAAAKPPEPKRFDWQNRRVAEQSIQWMPDAKHLLLAAKGDLFLLDIGSKKWQQLTSTPAAERDPKVSPDGKQIAFRIDHDLYVMEISSKKVVRLTTDGSENLLNGELDWVYPEELEIGTAFWWSPDSTKIAYLQFDTSKIGIYPQTELLSQSPFEEPQKYPKAGTPNSDVRLGIIATEGGPTNWIDLGDPRQHLLARVHWTPASDALFIQKLNRVQNRLDLVSVASGTGATKTILTETDRAWINVGDEFQFLPSRKRFLWASERSGFRHLYLYDENGTQIRQLTGGEWEVTGDVAADDKNGKVYFSSTEPSPLERQFWAVDLDGGNNKKRLSAGEGTHSVSMSPAGDLYLDSYSSLRDPMRTTLYRADGREAAVFKAPPAIDYDLCPTQTIKVQSPDGATLYARLIKPHGFDPQKKYPAVVMVYGGPHAQTVRDSWTGPNWEQLLAQKGFVVWGLDNRGSAGRGHGWESRLYRRFGKQELEDQRAGVDHLVKMGFVDPARIGIYGWSYGGFMTIYALLNAPDLFAAGIAGAPVTSWRNYDTIYTERYLGLPQENEAGYRDSSAITYAANLKAKLLLIHNYGDDNVLFQNTFQMSDALQKAGKLFEMMIYPQKAHGVTGEGRKHLNRVTTDFFERTLKN